jgi:hypothetical protein
VALYLRPCPPTMLRMVPPPQRGEGCASGSGHWPCGLRLRGSCPLPGEWAGEAGRNVQPVVRRVMGHRVPPRGWVFVRPILPRLLRPVRGRRGRLLPATGLRSTGPATPPPAARTTCVWHVGSAGYGCGATPTPPGHSPRPFVLEPAQCGELAQNTPAGNDVDKFGKKSCKGLGRLWIFRQKRVQWRSICDGRPSLPL